MIRESLRSYDSYKLDNGEARERSFDDYEPDDEIELPLTCQTCRKEYWWSEDGATLGYCPKCNETIDDSRSASPNKAVDLSVNAAAIIGGVVIGVMVGICFLFE